MKYLVLTLVFLTTLAFASVSQNSGFGGKRVALEAEILNGIDAPLNEIDISYILSRKFILNAGLSYSNANYTQIYKPADYLGETGPKEMPDKANIRSKSASIGGQYYISTNEATLPAPYGFFLYGNLEAGQMDIEGSYYRSLIEFDREDNEVVNYTYNGLPFLAAQIGIGKNWLLSNRIFFGTKICYHHYLYYSSFDASLPSLASIGVKRTYGTNLIDFGRIEISRNELLGLKPYKPTGNKKHYSGISIFVSMGVFIF